MERLSDQEQLVTFISFSSIFVILIELLFLPPDYNLKWFIVGMTITVISSLLIYTFLIHPGRNRTRLWGRNNGSYSSYSSNFRPSVIKPSGRVKKTITDGSCSYCHNPALMGFICSYCNNYFCPEHRLPEKHECLGLRNL